MISDPTDLNLAVLQALGKNNEAVGSGTLYLVLRDRGFSVSAPTIGRRLRDLEVQGLVKKSSVDGRVLTDLGREALRRWEQNARVERKNSTFLRVVRSADTKHILDLLGARRLIEREIAALAADRTTRQDTTLLARIIDRQRLSVERGDLGIEEDIAFHEEIARISNNAVLQSIVGILRGNEHYNYLITVMRRTVGSRLIVDHTRIFEAIAARDRDAAWQAMDHHLAALTRDVRRYVYGRLGRKMGRRESTLRQSR